MMMRRLILCFYLLLILILSYLTQAELSSQHEDIETYNEVITNTLYSNNQQLTTFQFILTRDTHHVCPTTKRGQSTEYMPFSIFPPQIYQLLTSTSLEQFDYATTQGQWDSGWGPEYSGLFGLKNFSENLQQNADFTPKSSFYAHNHLHMSPQPHGGLLSFKFTSSTNKNVDHIAQHHALTTNVLSHIFCSALQQITIDQAYVQAPEEPSKLYTITSLLPVEGLCTEHIVSMRKILPFQTPIPPATTIFHSSYISFRVSTEIVPFSKDLLLKLGPLPPHQKAGRVKTIVSLSFVKNIAPHDQTHIYSTNIATTTFEMHKVPQFSLPSSTNKNRVNVQDEILSFDLSAFGRPHKPNISYLQQQAIGSSLFSSKRSNPIKLEDYHFGKLSNEFNLPNTSIFSENCEEVSVNCVIKLFLQFNAENPFHVDDINDKMGLFDHILTYTSYNEVIDYMKPHFFANAKNDIKNAFSYILNNFDHSGNTHSSSHAVVPSWMCAYLKVSTDGEYTCNHWLFSLFNYHHFSNIPAHTVDSSDLYEILRKSTIHYQLPWFIHSTLPHYIQMYTEIGNNSFSPLTLVIHREACVSQTPNGNTFTIYTLFDADNEEIMKFSSLYQLISYFSQQSITISTYSLHYYTPVHVGPHHKEYSHAIYPSAHAAQLLYSPTINSTLPPAISKSIEKYKKNLILPLLSSLLTNNNLYNYNEKVYLLANHHLYYNLMAMTSQTIMQYNDYLHDFIALSRIQNDGSSLSYDIDAIWCKQLLLYVSMVNYYNYQNALKNGPIVVKINEIDQITTPKITQNTDNQYIYTSYAFIPRNSHHSMDICTNTPLYLAISAPNNITNPFNLLLSPHILHKSSQHQVLATSVLVERYFSSHNIDQADFIIKMSYSPLKMYQNSVKPDQIQHLPQFIDNILLIHHQTIIPWKAGDIYFDRVKLDASTCFSSQNGGKTELTTINHAVDWKYVISSVKSDQGVYTSAFGGGENNDSTHTHACIGFQRFVSENSAQIGSDYGQVNEIIVKNNIFRIDFDPRCVYLQYVMGQSRQTPSVINVYYAVHFTTDHSISHEFGQTMTHKQAFSYYKSITLSIPIVKALFRVSESHTDIARGLDIISGSTDLSIISKSFKTGVYTTIQRYTIPTSNTSMYVPFPDASMPFNATAIISTLLAFAFGSFFKILYPSDHDFISLQRKSKIKTLIEKFKTIAAKFHRKPKSTLIFPPQLIQSEKVCQDELSPNLVDNTAGEPIPDSLSATPLLTTTIPK